MMKTQVFTVSPYDDGRRLDQVLANLLGREFSRTEIQRIISARGVLLNGRSVTKSNTLLKGNDGLSIEYEESQTRLITPENIPLQIVYEDDDLLVIDKPAGMVVHPSPGHWTGTVVNALVGQGISLSAGTQEQRPGIVHRLDKDTSGLLIIAKNDPAHRKLTQMMQQREIRKIYFSLVSGSVQFEEGFVDAPMGMHPKTRLQRAIRRDALGKEAYTEYWVLERLRGATYLRVRLHTGRTHQIRVHMTYIGHSVLGDHLYGPMDKWGRLALHAGELEFEHPSSGEMMRLEAPLPPDFMAIYEEERARK